MERQRPGEREGRGREGKVGKDTKQEGKEAEKNGQLRGEEGEEEEQ